MIWIFYAVCVCFVALCFWYLQREREMVRRFFNQVLGLHNDMEESLLLGLYHKYRHRTKEEREELQKEEGPVFYKSPWNFEEFVKDIMVEIYKGRGDTTSGSGDQGVDIIIVNESERYLGQVKCYYPNAKHDFEVIAIVHSRMVKDSATKGFIATTAKFSKEAIRYAADLSRKGYSIELIDGQQLIKYWVEAMIVKEQNFTYGAVLE